MAKRFFAPSLICAFVLGALAARLQWGLPAAAASTNPTIGWTVHIDAEQHFGDSHPAEIAHHWCKPVSGGLTECQIYDSDAPDARLVAVETIVTPATYKSFSPAEQAYWHYHKVELAKVKATFPDMTPEQAAKMVAAISNTYGKIWVLWDPLTNADPIGTPTITVLK